MTDDFAAAFEAALNESDEAFRGSHAEALKSLTALGKNEIDAITPGPRDMQEYDRLIAVVRTASSRNMSNAALADRIQKLGTVAVSIARKMPSLAAIL